MYVQNFIPTAIEISDSVAEAKWKAKLAFLRKTTLWYGASFILVAAVAFLLRRPGPVLPAIAILAVATVLLALPRTMYRQRSQDAVYSLAVYPIFLVALALVVGRLEANGRPVWVLAFPWFAASCYTFLCGRDFSFVGQFALGLIFTVVSLALIAISRNWSAARFLISSAAAITYLVYYCWDLASLMSRRRSGEWVVSSVDLHRDGLNVVGYSIRCVNHWKRNRFFLDPWIS